MHNGDLGSILKKSIDATRIETETLMRSLVYIGSTLCSDDIKAMKRNTINTTLMSSIGAFFARSSDVTGKYKSAEFLLDDIISAILFVNADKVFIVCMDGACKKTLKLINADGLVYNKIFGLRCATHGCSLLLADIGRSFLFVIEMCVRLLKFVCNHEPLYDALNKDPNATNLLGIVETRFAAQVYSAEQILKDKDALKRLFVNQLVLDYINRLYYIILRLFVIE